ncbi:MAG TPA: DUF4397 domain-containing protein [Herpetosiphonaceae bacterium]
MKRLIGLFAVLMMIAASTVSGYAQSANTVRIMHASPDAPAVDIFVNGSAVLTNVPFFALSDRLSLPDGTYDVAIAPAGAGKAAAVWSGPLSVSGGLDATIVALNSVKDLTVKVYPESRSAIPEGQARVRVLHASPDAPAVDIKLAGTSTVVVKGASFTDAATVEVPAGIYQFDISPAGSSQVVFTTPKLRFENGWGYTLVATGFLSQNFWVQSRVDRITR